MGELLRSVDTALAETEIDRGERKALRELVDVAYSSAGVEDEARGSLDRAVGRVFNDPTRRRLRSRPYARSVPGACRSLTGSSGPGRLRACEKAGFDRSTI
jgi:hypothetical protein